MYALHIFCLLSSCLFALSPYLLVSVSQQIVPEDLRPVLTNPVQLESNRKVHHKPYSPARVEPRSTSSRPVQVALGRGRLYVLSLISGRTHWPVGSNVCWSVEEMSAPPLGICCQLSSCLKLHSRVRICMQNMRVSHKADGHKWVTFHLLLCHDEGLAQPSRTFGLFGALHFPLSPLGAIYWKFSCWFHLLMWIFQSLAGETVSHNVGHKPTLDPAMKMVAQNTAEVCRAPGSPRWKVPSLWFVEFRKTSEFGVASQKLPQTHKLSFH